MQVNLHGWNTRGMLPLWHLQGAWLGMLPSSDACETLHRHCRKICSLLLVCAWCTVFPLWDKLFAYANFTRHSLDLRAE